MFLMQSVKALLAYCQGDSKIERGENTNVKRRCTNRIKSLQRADESYILIRLSFLFLCFLFLFRGKVGTRGEGRGKGEEEERKGG